ncbi:MAG: hypothetical protein ACXWA3_01845 [Acidimicrobiales bacterium]
MWSPLVRRPNRSADEGASPSNCRRFDANNFIGGDVICMLHVEIRHLRRQQMPTAKKGTTRTKTPMTDAHKAALAEGREQGRAVRAYLDAVEANAPKRGRKRTPESIAKRLDAIDAEMAAADPLKRVGLIQERIDLQAELAVADDKVDMSALEAAFIAAAKPYSDRKGITRAAWREVGVAPSVLKAAGI